MFCIIKIKSETNSHHSEESMSAQNRKSCNTAIRSVCHTPEPLRRRNGLRCAALFLRLRTVRAPACGRARAGSDSGRGVPTRRAAFGSRAARAARVPRGGCAPFLLQGGKRRTTPKICRLTKAARCAILHSDGRRKFALRRPGIGAYAEISRAFRCVYREFAPNGRKFQDATHFAPNSVVVFVQFRREPESFPPGPASRRNRVPPIAGATAVRASAAVGRRAAQNQGTIRQMEAFCDMIFPYENYIIYAERRSNRGTY